MGQRLGLLMLKGYVSTVGRTSLVVIGVFVVLLVALLVAVGISSLVHHRDHERAPVVTVPATR